MKFSKAEVDAIIEASPRTFVPFNKLVLSEDHQARSATAPVMSLPELAASIKDSGVPTTARQLGRWRSGFVGTVRHERFYAQQASSAAVWGITLTTGNNPTGPMKWKSPARRERPGLGGNRINAERQCRVNGRDASRAPHKDLHMVDHHMEIAPKSASHNAPAPLAPSISRQRTLHRKSSNFHRWGQMHVCHLAER